MGEIAEAMLNGEFCTVCGEYIENEAGYPKTCFSCDAIAASRFHKDDQDDF
jgi:hypothetical protein